VRFVSSSAAIVTVEDDDGTFWAVLRIGPFEEHDDAHAAAWFLADEMEFTMAEQPAPKPTLLG